MTAVRLLTPPGRGAVATLSLSGDLGRIDADPPLLRCVTGQFVAALPLGRVVFGRWGTTAVEEVVVCRLAEDRLELCCHGGIAAAGRIISDLRERGCSVVDDPLGQVSRSSTLHEPGSDRILIEQECLSALSRSTTLRAADMLLQQHGGLLREAIERLTDADPASLQSQLNELLRWAPFGLHLAEPWRVVLCGQPNVGKSSLINALVGFTRSIVFDQPGTTRDVVTAETALEGWPVLLTDTAGLRDQADALESAGIERARQAIAHADLIVVLLDVSRPPDEEDRRLLRTFPKAIVVAHKSDLPSARGDELPKGALPVSSLTGEGLNELIREIVLRLVPAVPAPMTPLPVSERQVTLLHELLRMVQEENNRNKVLRTISELLTGSAESSRC